MYNRLVFLRAKFTTISFTILGVAVAVKATVETVGKSSFN